MTRFTTVSDSRLALWLSAVSEVVNGSAERSRREHVLQHPMVQGAVRHAQISSTSGNTLNLDFSHPEDSTAHISHLSFVLANAKLQNSQQAEKNEEELQRLYSDRDPHWSKCVLKYIEYYLLGRKPHYRNWKQEGCNNLNYSLIENRLPNDARVGLIFRLGYWHAGCCQTGTNDARTESRCGDSSRGCVLCGNECRVSTSCC